MIHSQMQWMNEAFLQFAWANRHFDPGGLLSTSGEPIDILEPGTWNQDQGPDFVMARIRIADQVWVGHVEIHCRSSDWQRHRHTGDPSYGNIILHVVWEADTLLGPDCPVLELNGRIPGRTIERFTTWMTGPTSFPCAPDFRQAAKHADQIWRKELVTSRLEARASEILARLEQHRGNWLSTIWIQVARGFGYRVNADAFTAIARSIPYTCLARHRDDLHLLEALLLGQAGCLAQSFTDAYPGMLKKEYQILRRKYRLPAVNVILHFLRMRPVNFPTVRLAQLAMLIHRHLAQFRISAHGLPLC